MEVMIIDYRAPSNMIVKAPRHVNIWVHDMMVKQQTYAYCDV